MGDMPQIVVMPAEAGIQIAPAKPRHESHGDSHGLGSRLRGNDKK